MKTRGRSRHKPDAPTRFAGPIMIARERWPLERLLSLVGPFEPGSVAIVGAGPGDSALISVRGAARLMQADVVLHDKLIGPELLDLPRAEAERIFVGKWRRPQETADPEVGRYTGETPVPHREGEHVWTQDEINAALVKHARAGRRVVRLKGGDPFVFGRGGEECEHLAAHHIRFEVVPGITAAFGAPTSAGIPLTDRRYSRSFTLVTGHLGPDDPEELDYEALARTGTLAIYMGMKHLADNCERLIEAGMDVRTPAAVIQWGTRPQQRTIVGTVADIADRVAEENVTPPAMILIGEVVRIRESIEWFESRPLHGRTVVVTRMKDQSAALSGPLLAAGAEVIEAPTIELAAVEDHAAVDDALRNLSRYDWLVLTSANGVDAMMARLDTMGLDVRALAGPRIAAIGSATAGRLLERGIRADVVPGEAVGEAMAEALLTQGIAGKRVLLLCGDIARPELPAALREAGGVCDDLAVYRTVCPERLPDAFLERFDAGGVDWITLTSPSSWHNLHKLLGEPRAARLRGVRLASIGPVTTQAIRASGFTEAVEADPHDVPGLVAAIERAVRQPGGEQAVS